MSDIVLKELFFSKKVCREICEKLVLSFPDQLSFNKFSLLKINQLNNIFINNKVILTDCDYNTILNAYVEIISHIIIYCEGNLIKTNNMCKVFTKRIDLLYIDSFIIALIEKLEYSLENDEIILNDYFHNNTSVILATLNNLKNSPPHNLISLLKIICENKNNEGRLCGNVIVEENIVYQKRKGPEFSINFTNKCPNACIFCVRDINTGWGNDNLYLYRDPTVEEVKQAIFKEISSRTDEVSLVKFCGYGEPLLRSTEIIEITKFIREILPKTKIQINTSGWPFYLYGNINLNDYKNAGITSFSISINAPNKELYNKITRPGVYDIEEKAFENTLKFIKECVTYQFKTKCTLVNIELLKNNDIIETEKIVKNLGANFIARNFIGDFNKIRTDKRSRSIKTKVLDIDRLKLLNILKNDQFKLKFAEFVKIHLYDIPHNLNKRDNILNLLERNPPELRKYYELFLIIKSLIKENKTLSDSHSCLRIREECGIASLILRRPDVFTDSIKYESEYFYQLENIEEGKKIISLLGLEEICAKEIFRESFSYFGILFNIDTWPRLPSYLEIKAVDEMDVYNGLKLLDIDFKDAVGIHKTMLYSVYGLEDNGTAFSEENKRAVQDAYLK